MHNCSHNYAHHSSCKARLFICWITLHELKIVRLAIRKKKQKHRVTIPCKGVFRLKSGGFHEIRMKSGGFHVKSTQNLVKAGVSTKTIQFDECRRGAMTLDFMKSGVIAPSMQPPQTEEFLLKHLTL